MSAVIFQGSAVKALKNELKFFTAGSIQSGTVDPSSVATSGDKGSLYINTSSALVYRKTDNGSSTNWTSISTAQANLNVVSKTANYTISVNDDLVLADASGGTFTLTFPSAAGNDGKRITIKKTDSTFNQVTVAVASGNLNTEGEIRVFVSDGSSWQLVDWIPDTSWTSYTPGFNGGGTVTDIDFKWKRVAGSIYVVGGFTAGNTTGVEARIDLPSGLTISSTLPTTPILGVVGVGKLSIPYFSSTQFGWTVLATPSDSYVKFGAITSTTSELVSKFGNQTWQDNAEHTVKFDVEIEGWSR